MNERFLSGDKKTAIRPICRIPESKEIGLTVSAHSISVSDKETLLLQLTLAKRFQAVRFVTTLKTSGIDRRQVRSCCFP
ncbi:MAG: hypothetical protein V1714_05420 [Pseudomonadota bacterium]